MAHDEKERGEEEGEEEKEDVSVTGCRLRSAGIALVRQWILVYTSVLFMLLVDIISSRLCIWQ